MHGLGNDFVVVDERVTQRVELSAERIRALGDRHTRHRLRPAAGGQTPDDPEADFRYRIYNADGTEAEQCGNGARCFARFVRERRSRASARSCCRRTPAPSPARCTATASRWTWASRAEGRVRSPSPPNTPNASTRPRRPGAALGARSLDAIGGGHRRARARVHGQSACGDLRRRRGGARTRASAPACRRIRPSRRASTSASASSSIPASRAARLRARRGYPRLRLRRLRRGGRRRSPSAAQRRVKVSLPGGKLRIEWQGPWAQLLLHDRACRRPILRGPPGP